MSVTTPATETISSDAAVEQWEALLERVSKREARFLVEREGKSVAALVSARDLEIFDMLVQQWEQDSSLVHELRERFKDISDDEIEREVAKAVAEVRAEQQAEIVTSHA